MILSISSDPDCRGRSVTVQNGAFAPTLQGTNFDNNLASYACYGKSRMFLKKKTPYSKYFVSSELILFQFGAYQPPHI